MAYMTAQEFINKALDVALNYNTTYVWSFKGKLLDKNPSNNVYVKGIGEARINARTDVWNNISTRCQNYPCYGFDCSGFVTALLHGWTAQGANSGIDFASRNLNNSNESYTLGADSMDVRASGGKIYNFSNIVPGELIHSSGHIGIYIGLGLVVEAATGFQCKVELTGVKNSGVSSIYQSQGKQWLAQNNLSVAGERSIWDYHFKIDCIDYTNAANAIPRVVGSGYTPSNIPSVSLTRIGDNEYGRPGVDMHNSNHRTLTELQNAGQEFIILRCGHTWWGSTGSAADESFNELYNTFHGKFPLGAYFYSGVNSQQLADQEVELTKQMIEGKTFELPIYYDLEDDSNPKIKTLFDAGRYEELGQYAAYFCEQIKAFGFVPGIYANTGWFCNKKFFDQIKQYRLWWADWRTSVSQKQATFNDFKKAVIKSASFSEDDFKNVDIWQIGSSYINGSKTDVNVLFTNIDEYISSGGSGSSFVYINYKKYYAKKADSEEIEKEFTDFLEAIAWIDDQNKGITILSDKYFLYNEDNTIAYPYNVKLYQISEKDKITLDSDILNKCILLETAYNKLQELAKENKKTYYIINSKNQAIYAENENGIKDLYVVRTLLEDNYMGSDITQTCNSWFKGYCWREWRDLDDKSPGKYGVFKITGLEESELIYPVDYFYRIYKGTKQESTPLVDLKYSSRNLQSLINICNKLGYKYYIYNENTQSIEYQIDPSFFLPNDIVGLVGSENNDEYKIDSINSDGEVNLYKIISSEEDGDHFEDTLLTGKTIYDLYPIRTQISSDNNSDFFINLLYTHLKDKNGADIKETAFNDILKVTKCVYMKNNASNEEDLIPYLVGKLKSKITGEIIDDTIYYLPYSYLTKTLEES